MAAGFYHPILRFKVGSTESVQPPQDEVPVSIGGGNWYKIKRRKKRGKYGHEVLEEEREAAQGAYAAAEVTTIKPRELLARTLTEEQAAEDLEAVLETGDEEAIAIVLAIASTIH
jgi:hypothetical protein